jgi:hypothetical protein
VSRTRRLLRSTHGDKRWRVRAFSTRSRLRRAPDLSRGRRPDRHACKALQFGARREYWRFGKACLPNPPKRVIHARRGATVSDACGRPVLRARHRCDIISRSLNLSFPAFRGAQSNQTYSGESSTKHRRYRFVTVLGSVALAGVTAVVVNLVNKGTDGILSANDTVVSYSSAPLQTECGVVTFLPEPIAREVLSQPAPQSFAAIEDRPGAAPAGKAIVEASIQGVTARAITITRISFKFIAGRSQQERRSPNRAAARSSVGPLRSTSMPRHLGSLALMRRQKPL